MSEKVLLILVDGMRADSISACGDPEFEGFMRSGTYSFQGKTVFPPVTLPCHMSLFHSVDPERHGVYSNTYIQQNHPIDGLIEVLTAQRKKSGFFYTWEQLRDLYRPDSHMAYSWYMDQRFFVYPELKNIREVEHRATEAAKENILEFAPDFVFLYLGGADEYGHNRGWMSCDYLEEVRWAWRCIRDICAVLPEEYNVIITADHGGHLRNHGENIPEDMTTPVSFHGPGFIPGRELGSFSIKDIAPTITDILGIEPGIDWEGRSILRQ